jgi:hypothetical protein
MDEQRLEEIAKLVERLREHAEGWLGPYYGAPPETWQPESEDMNETAMARDCWKAAEALSSQEEELRSLRGERDALSAQLRGVGIVPYLDRMKELAEARDEALALMKRDQPDMYRALLADQAKQDELRARAESAEAELQRLRGTSSGLDRPRAQVCADHGCQVLPEYRHAALVDECAKEWAMPERVDPAKVGMD